MLMMYGKTCQYYSCWCCDLLPSQAVSSHDVDYNLTVNYSECSSNLIKINTIVSHTSIVPGIPHFTRNNRQCVACRIMEKSGFICEVDPLAIASPTNSQMGTFPVICGCTAFKDDISECIDFLVLWSIINDSSYWKLNNIYQMQQ